MDRPRLQPSNPYSIREALPKRPHGGLFARLAYDLAALPCMGWAAGPIAGREMSRAPPADLFHTPTLPVQCGSFDGSEFLIV